jgi:hypothetical protein
LVFSFDPRCHGLCGSPGAAQIMQRPMWDWFDRGSAIAPLDRVGLLQLDDFRVETFLSSTKA